MKPEYIYAIETTPYETTKVEGGFVVRQAWWNKVVSPIFATREEAEQALIPIARSAGCYRRIRFRK